MGNYHCLAKDEIREQVKKEEADKYYTLLEELKT